MSVGQDNLQQCYNRGCGQRYDPNKNKEDSCTHHPGVPVFHDAYKGWSCCNKKTTDFTEFLNIKGCTLSFHSNVKPSEPEKPKAESPVKDEVPVSNIPKPQNTEVMVRPSENTPMVKLPAVVGASLKPILEKMGNTVKTSDTSEGDETIQIGTACKNGACKKIYEGEESNLTVCTYHPGVPVFHEGLKYWSCCVRRTTDFETFLEQEGCTQGRHVWTKKKETVISCRYDWHQTGSHIVISVYSKAPIPDLSCIQANPVKLLIHIVFGEERNVFEKEMILCGVIDVEKSKVSYLGSKVEINMKKAEPISWSKLMLTVKSAVPSQTENDNNKNAENDVESDDNLDDIIS